MKVTRLSAERAHAVIEEGGFYGSIDRDGQELVQWPIWLTPIEFARWYEEENASRIQQGCEQLPDLPDEVASMMGLRNDHEADAKVADGDPDPLLWRKLT